VGAGGAPDRAGSPTQHRLTPPTSHNVPFETHIHNDYVSGGLVLARVTGVAYHVNAADDVAYEHRSWPTGGGGRMILRDSSAVI
jgi:hypothetical protein